MKNPICTASYERAVQLKAAGCPIDYLNALPRLSFLAEKPAYIEGCVYALGPLDTAYVIPIRLATKRSPGTIITGWSFELGKNHDIELEEPTFIIPKTHHDAYKHLFKSPLMDVLNDRRLIRPGCPVEGVVCLRSFQALGEDSHRFISAKLSFTDDLGTTVQLCIDLSIDKHTYSSASLPLSGEVRHRLFRHVDSGGRLDPNAIPADPASESGSLRGDAELGVPDRLEPVKERDWNNESECQE